MMFWSEPLKVVLASVHIPLREVPSTITRRCSMTSSSWPSRVALFGIAAPRLALAGLNPHAGEERNIGDEEQRVFRPAVEARARRGIAIDGPIPGDTVFVRAVRGEFDAVIASYHDQGLIPVKLLAFGAPST